MVATRRQSKRLKEKSSLALRSKTASEVPQSADLGPDSQGHTESDSSSDAKPQQNSLPTAIESVSNISDGQNAEDEGSPDGSASSEHKSNGISTEQTQEENSMINHHASIDPIQDNIADVHVDPGESHPSHIRFDRQAARGENGAPVGGLGSSERKITDSDGSDDDAAPEIAGTSRSQGQSNGNILPMKKRRRRKQGQKRLQDEEPTNDLPSKSQEPITIDHDSESLSAAKSRTESDARKKRKLLDTVEEKPRKDLVNGNVTYRFEQSERAPGAKVPPKQNPLSRQLKESLLKRKKTVSTAKSRFLRV